MKKLNRAWSHSLVWTILLLIVLFFFWEYGADREIIDTFFFSSPSRIGVDLKEMWDSGLMSKHVTVTLREAAGGLFYGCVLGTVTAFVFGVLPKLNEIFMPIMVGINGLPKLALGPLLIFWFGIGYTSKVVMSAMMVYFIFLFNMFAGYNDVDVNLINAVRMLGGSRLQVLRKVIWPSCIPWFLASMRTGMGMSLTGAIVGEYIGSSRGLGWMISDAGGTYNITRVLSCVFILIVIMTVLDYFLRFLEKITLRWRPSTT